MDNNDNKHSLRMAIVLVLGVLALVVVSAQQFSDSGKEEQQAAVLRAYAE